MGKSKCEAWRWSRDEDGWLNRPVLKRDGRIPRSAEMNVVGEAIGSDFIGTGRHAFICEGLLFCRNAKQRVRLDRGLPV